MRNRAWFLIAKKEYLQRVRSRSYLAVTFLVPLIVGLILAIPSKLSSMQEGRGYAIAILDSTGTVSNALQAELQDGPWGRKRKYDLLETPLGLRRDDLVTWVREGALDAMVVVVGNADHAETGELVASSQTDSLTMWHLRMALSRAVMKSNLRHHGMDLDRIIELTRPLPVSVVKIRASQKRDPEAIFPLVLFMAMVLYMTLLIYGMATMRSVVEEKSSKTVEILLASVRPAELLAGKILGVAFVGLTQYFIWIVLSSAASGGCAGPRGISLLLGAGNNLENVWIELLPAMVGFFVLGYLLYACLYALAGSLASQPSDTQQLQFPITMMLLIPIVLLPVALTLPDAPLVRALSLVPFFSPILMFCRIAVSDSAAWESALSVVLLLLAVGIAWRFTARVYRVTILLYGKRVTLREVARWIHHE